MMKEVLRSAAGGRMPSPDEVPGAPAVFDVPLEGAVLVGFAGLHFHADFSLFAQPNVPSKLAEGVRTEAIGNRDFLIFPEPSYWIKLTDKYSLDAAHYGSAVEYLTYLRTHHTASNIATLVSPCSIRSGPGLERLFAQTTAGQEVSGRCHER